MPASGHIEYRSRHDSTYTSPHKRSLYQNEPPSQTRHKKSCIFALSRILVAFTSIDDEKQKERPKRPRGSIHARLHIGQGYIPYPHEQTTPQNGKGSLQLRLAMVAPRCTIISNKSPSAHVDRATFLFTFASRLGLQVARSASRIPWGIRSSGQHSKDPASIVCVGDDRPGQRISVVARSVSVLDGHVILRGCHRIPAKASFIAFE